ncbi:hypothetical protein [Halorubrum tebenquichense]|uniref:hypothetical protein n=1 Tax=Halorubrum tebenquichense TaxID=119434 RepID=UPI001267B251|nr:hypothetical protein [Halorubrum tebenquichense]
MSIPWVEFAQISISFALLAVTAVYTYFTHKNNQQLKKNREADFRPVLTPSVTNHDGVNHFFQIENTGKGSAHNIRGEWWIDSIGEKKKWHMSTLVDGERQAFGLPFGEKNIVSAIGEIKNRIDEEDTLYVKFWYQDGLGNKFSPETEPMAEYEIDLVQVLDSWADSEGFGTQDSAVLEERQNVR